jgi:hypothetical protein
MDCPSVNERIQHCRLREAGWPKCDNLIPYPRGNFFPFYAALMKRSRMRLFRICSSPANPRDPLSPALHCNKPVAVGISVKQIYPRQTCGRRTYFSPVIYSGQGASPLENGGLAMIYFLGCSAQGIAVANGVTTLALLKRKLNKNFYSG